MGIKPQSLPFTAPVNESIDSVAAPLTGSEAAGQVFDSSFLDTGIQSLARISAVDDLNNGSEEYPPQELNSLHPGMPKPFTRPMNLQQASFIAEQQAEEMRRQQLINQGPKGLFYGALNFGAGLLPHALDPIELGAGYLVGAGLGVAAAGSRIGVALGVRTTQATGIAARMGLPLMPTTVGSTALQTFGRTAVEGAVGNAVVEPLMMAAASKDMREYTAETFFMSTIGGAVGFAGARYGVSKAMSFAFERGKRIHSSLFKSTAAQLDNAQVVNTKEWVKSMIDETNIKPNPDLGIRVDGKSDYVYAKKVNPVGDNVYVTFNRPTGTELKMSTLHNRIGDDYGIGIYATTDPFVANGTAGRADLDVGGSIYRMKVSDVKMADLDLKFGDDANLDRAVVDWFAKNNIRGVELNNKKTIKGIVEEARMLAGKNKISEKSFLGLKESFEGRGFDGMTHDNSSWGGFDHRPANTHIFFSADKLKKQGQFQANKEIVHKPSDKILTELREQQASKQNLTHYDREAEIILDKHIKKPQEGLESGEVQRLVNEEVKNLENDPNAKNNVEELAQFREFKKVTEKESQAWRKALDCFF